MQVHYLFANGEPYPSLLLSLSRRTKIPLSSVEILQDWFSAHVANPYPTDEEKAALMAKAKLDAVQLVNCQSDRARAMGDGAAAGDGAQDRGT